MIISVIVAVFFDVGRVGACLKVVFWFGGWVGDGGWVSVGADGFRVGADGVGDGGWVSVGGYGVSVDVGGWVGGWISVGDGVSVDVGGWVGGDDWVGAGDDGVGPASVSLSLPAPVAKHVLVHELAQGQRC